MILFSQTTFVMSNDVVFTKKFTAVHLTVRLPQILRRKLL